MRAPADSYWSIDACRWVRYTADAIEIPDQRAADPAVDQPIDVTPGIAPVGLPGASRDDLHP